jgi:ubiquinone/menaquinone biosynthesis C-methylase UbiE
MTSSFDERAQAWDEQPRRVQLAADIFAALEKQIPLHSDMAALDYGAGTGLLTLALAPRVRRITAVDSSAGMLEVLAQKARAAGFGSIVRLQSDFAKDSLPPGPYDLIASAMTLHHVADVAVLFRKFISLLARGGQIALADLDAEDGTFHENSGGIPHFGFDREGFSNQLAAAGFADIRFASAARIEKNARTYSVFLATARKP